MLQLPDSHPQLYEEFLNGHHTVSRAKSKSKFNTVSTDMALEQSMNKDTKTKGGITGFSQKYSSVEKWTLTSHLRAAVHSNFKEMIDPTVNQIKELTSSEKEREKCSINHQHRQRAVSVTLQTWNKQTTPFKHRFRYIIFFSFHLFILIRCL